MLKPTLVRHAALLWGLMLFMPVGMNYLGAVLLLAALLLDGRLASRYARLRQHPLWWPGLAFTGWTLLVLGLQPVYFPETPSNLFHGLRIVLTLALALALTREETVWALRGFLGAAALSLTVIAVHLAVGLPPWEGWLSLIRHDGNKAVSNALLLAFLAASSLVTAVSRPGRARFGALAFALVLVAALAWSLPSRTALLIIVLTVLAASVHQWRARRLQLAAALTTTVLVTTLALTALPAVRDRLAQGVTELQQAQAGEVSKASWGIRFHMLRQTSQMVRDKPWTGWGIGSWNSQWKQRMPPESWGFNMPHNDFLWAGAQAGLPGMLALLALVLAGVRQGWRRRDLTGRLGMVAALTLLLAASTNSAMRDAAIGLSLVWVVGLVLRLAAEPDDAVAAVIPLRSSLD